MRRQAAGLAAVALGPGLVPAGLAQRRELEEDAVEEEAQPRALPAPFPSHAVHAVVPVAAAHEGKAVGARGQPLVDGAQAVLEERGPVRPRRAG